jgi:hypothetical protein
MQLLKAKLEHTYKEQMEEPVVQLFEMETNTLKQKIQEYNTRHLVLQSKAKAIDKKEERSLQRCYSCTLCGRCSNEFMLTAETLTDGHMLICKAYY